MRKRFGHYLFDSGTRQLWRGRRGLALSPKALSLLELFLDTAPRALSKEEIQSTLWPDTFVSEANLTNLISEIRGALGETAQRPRYIRTVHRFGYAFSGDLAEEPAELEAPGLALYRLLLGRRRFALEGGENILGRHPDAQARIDQTLVSRRHARITIRADRMLLEDLGSHNGTFLNGRRLDKAVELHDGDIISLGPVAMTFRVFRGVGSTETASRA